MKTHSIRLPLTASLLSAFLFVSPAALASPGVKSEAAEHSFKVHKDKGWKKVSWKRSEKGWRHRPHKPTPPFSTPELDGAQWASAAALLGGAFLLLASRRRLPV